MEELILQSEPTYPPQAYGPIDSAYDVPIETIDEEVFGEVLPFYTHGRGLFDVKPVGRDHVDLLHLIIRCLADTPKDRPTLLELAEWVRYTEVQEGYNDPDDWYSDIFGSPPPVRPFTGAPGPRPQARRRCEERGS